MKNRKQIIEYLESQYEDGNNLTNSKLLKLYKKTKKIDNEEYNRIILYLDIYGIVYNNLTRRELKELYYKTNNINNKIRIFYNCKKK